MSPFQILPAERGFYDWFEKGAATARDAARLLANLLADYRDAEGRVLQITELEHQGDFIVREKKNLPRIKAYTVEINRLENEADRILRSGLARLVRQRDDWFEFQRWKEILEKIEQATDMCEDVADVLEAVAVKNA